jgi:hypothetical protein
MCPYCKGASKGVPAYVNHAPDGTPIYQCNQDMNHTWTADQALKIGAGPVSMLIAYHGDDIDAHGMPREWHVYQLVAKEGRVLARRIFDDPDEPIHQASSIEELKKTLDTLHPGLKRYEGQ